MAIISDHKRMLFRNIQISIYYRTSVEETALRRFRVAGVLNQGTGLGRFTCRNLGFTASGSRLIFLRMCGLGSTHRLTVVSFLG